MNKLLSLNAKHGCKPETNVISLTTFVQTGVITIGSTIQTVLKLVIDWINGQKTSRTINGTTELIAIGLLEMVMKKDQSIMVQKPFLVSLKKM